MSEQVIIDQDASVEAAIFRLSTRRDDVYQAILDQGAVDAKEQISKLVVAIGPNDSVEAAVQNIQQNSPDVAQALINQGRSEAEANRVKVDANLAIKMASDAGLPELAWQMVNGNMTLLEAKDLTARAEGIRNICAAVGISESFQVLIPHLSDSVKLAGMIAHEVQAEIDENRMIEGYITNNGSETENKKSGTKPEEIYKNR